MRGDRNERLTILSAAEKLALYGLPSFDDFGVIVLFMQIGALWSKKALQINQLHWLHKSACRVGGFPSVNGRKTHQSARKGRSPQTTPKSGDADLGESLKWRGGLGRLHVIFELFNNAPP
jgi:hypothetical protein